MNDVNTNTAGVHQFFHRFLLIFIEFGSFSQCFFFSNLTHGSFENFSVINFNFGVVFLIFRDYWHFKKKNFWCVLVMSVIVILFFLERSWEGKSKFKKWDKTIEKSDSKYVNSNAYVCVLSDFVWNVWMFVWTEIFELVSDNNLTNRPTISPTTSPTGVHILVYNSGRFREDVLYLIGSHGLCMIMKSNKTQNILQLFVPINTKYLQFLFTCKTKLYIRKSSSKMGNSIIFILELIHQPSFAKFKFLNWWKKWKIFQSNQFSSDCPAWWFLTFWFSSYHHT